LKEKEKNLFNKNTEDVLIDDIDDLAKEEILRILIENGKFKEKNKENKDKNIFKDVECQDALYVFSKQNQLRRTLYRIYKRKSFEYIIMFLILASSVKLAVDTYYIDVA